MSENVQLIEMSKQNQALIQQVRRLESDLKHYMTLYEVEHAVAESKRAETVARVRTKLEESKRVPLHKRLCNTSHVQLVCWGAQLAAGILLVVAAVLRIAGN